jgi:hypothetical protein
MDRPPTNSSKLRPVWRSLTSVVSFATGALGCAALYMLSIGCDAYDLSCRTLPIILIVYGITVGLGMGIVTVSEWRVCSRWQQLTGLVGFLPLSASLILVLVS